ncbi:MAG: hypothetical protein NTX03_05085 [Bacteroidetes bacterium]|nr:hypothetical protein [Bacteroidota bacterium]
METHEFTTHIYFDLIEQGYKYFVQINFHNDHAIDNDDESYAKEDPIKAALLAKGYTQADIDELETIANAINALINTLDTAKKQRQITTLCRGWWHTKHNKLECKLKNSQPMYIHYPPKKNGI